MKTEELKELGLNQEQIDGVMKLNGLDIEGVKAKGTKLESQLEKAKEDIKARDEQLNELSKINPEQLQAEIERLQAENETRESEHQKALKDIQITNAIRLALNGKAHDPDLASTLFDRTQLVFNDDGKVIGLEDQLTKLQSEKAYLFKQEETGREAGFKFGVEPKAPEGSIKTAISQAFGNVKED